MMMKVLRVAATLALGVFVTFGYQNCAPSDDASTGTSKSTSGKVVYADIRDQIFASKCAACHNQTATGFLSYATFMANNYVVAGDANSSSLYLAVTTGTMPQGGSKLSTADITLIQKWIAGGAPETATSTPAPTAMPTVALAPTYSSLRANVFTPACVSCHGSSSPAAGYDMSTYQGVMARVFSVNPDASKLYTVVNGSGTGASAVAYTMPKGGAQLTVAQIAAIKGWINAGAPNN